jgi:O-antigen ligase
MTRLFEKRHGAALWAVLLLAGLVPLLWGGNRPLIWYAVALFAGLLGAAIAFHALRRGPPLRIGLNRDPVLLGAVLMVPGVTALLTLVGLIAPGLSGNLSPGASVIATVRIAALVLLGLLTFHLLSERNGRRSFGIRLLLIAIAHAVYGLVTLRSPELALIANPFYPDSLTAGFVNRNSAAAFLGFGLCLAVAGLLSEPDRGGSRVDLTQRRALFALAALLLATALLLTRSRMGVVATGCGLGLIALLALRGSGGAGVRMIAWGVLGLLPAGLLLFVYHAIDRVERLREGAGERLGLYREVLEMIRNAPLLGAGPGNFEIGFRPWSGRLTDPGLRWEDAHNTLLEAWAENGVIFGSVPALVLLLILSRLIRLATGPGDRFLPLAASGAVLLGLLHSLVDFPLEIHGNLLFLSLLIAGALAGARRGGAS